MNRLLPILFFNFILLSTLSAQQTGTISLAVNDLEAQGVKASEAAVISEQLRAELMKYPNMRMIERGQMEVILKEQGFQQSGCTSDACAVEVGQLLGVTNIAVGSVGRAGSYTVLTVRVLNVATGEIVVNKSMQTRGGIDKVLESGIKIIGENLQQGLFPDPEKKSKISKPKNRSAGKIILIGGGSLALIGGGVAAFLFLKEKDSADNTPNYPNNTRIELP